MHNAHPSASIYSVEYANLMKSCRRVFFLQCASPGLRPPKSNKQTIYAVAIWQILVRWSKYLPQCQTITRRTALRLYHISWWCCAWFLSSDIYPVLFAMSKSNFEYQYHIYFCLDSCIWSRCAAPSKTFLRINKLHVLAYIQWWTNNN